VPGESVNWVDDLIQTGQEFEAKGDGNMNELFPAHLFCFVASYAK